MQITEHPSFSREFKKFSKKQVTASAALKYAKRLIPEYFEQWKYEMVLPKSNLSPSKYPRIWLSVNKETGVILLLLAAHQDGYDNNTCDQEAVRRYNELA